jgi:hypothetical protein
MNAVQIVLAILIAPWAVICGFLLLTLTGFVIVAPYLALHECYKDHQLQKMFDKAEK